MTHMWKSKETYKFDIPSPGRLQDIYWKNTVFPLRAYLIEKNPKVSDVKFDPYYLAVNVTVNVPKYPKSYPYFTNADELKLLTSYMEYANMSLEDMRARPFGDQNAFGQ